jgi:hypothetical protein
MQTRRTFLKSLIATGALGAIGGAAARTQETIKIGFSAPMTGPFAMNGKQMLAAVRLFVAQHGNEVAGKTVELIVRDDAGLADQGKRRDTSGIQCYPGHACGGSDFCRGENPASRYGIGSLNHHGAFALYRPYFLHAGAVRRANGAMGQQEWNQEGRDLGLRFRRGARLREGIRRRI